MSVASAKTRLGVALLCHAQLDIAVRMARIWAEGGAAVAIHLDSKAGDEGEAQMRSALADLADVSFVRRRDCEWGMYSLVAATQDAADALLKRHPDVSHVLLASGSCLPLRPAHELAAYLNAHPDTDFIESVAAREAGWTIGGLDTERFTLFFPFSWRRQRRLFDKLTEWQRRLRIQRKLPTGVVPYLGSQWWCLTRETLSRILNDPRRAEFDRYFSRCWIPDESYFQSLTRRHARRIESRSLTLSKFDHQGKPYIFYDDHAEMLRRSHCFVARKIWPGATRLFESFPEAQPANTPLAEPNPVRIDRLITRTVERRTLGRPGLYMQSRFPAKDRENGKTAVPYTVLQGFSDIFPNFEQWLQARVEADVNGHLMAWDRIEFAGRPDIGPGAISAHPWPRDYDPQGFLTSLLRITDRTQCFMYGPRDNQALNWFMATDPNARLHVVTGAWILPLMESEMPFDDVRRMAMQLQAIEAEELGILRSVWVKAQIEIWELSDFLARPAAVLQRIVHDMSHAGWPHYDSMPEMRDISGIPAFLQKLRNAGLRPQLMGEFALSPVVGGGEISSDTHNPVPEDETTVPASRQARGRQQ